ncbi:cyclic lactone autoinducer peptide [Zhenpiania hominis]|uniref:Cyclic lactone autoinducer peptide n=1 Tax=Zhenpiania hominis TaxID=2763644 RepID=A0A923SQI1_9FIRM|nr:cyclic lactone autoinducer peptide [Zhenpiania hominis]
MFKKMLYKVLPVFTLALVFFADTAANTSTFLHHGEPDCPEELLK